MKFKDLNNNVKIKFIKDSLLELYPFSLDDFRYLGSKIDFKVISKNQYIDWDLFLLRKYYDKWDWEEIENNPIICREVNLGLLFPDSVKTSKPKCDCYKELDYCNMDKYCNSTYDRVKMIKKPCNPLNPKLFGYIKFLIDEDYIDNTIMRDVLIYDMMIDFGDYGGDYETEFQPESHTNDYEDLPF